MTDRTDDKTPEPLTSKEWATMLLACKLRRTAVANQPKTGAKKSMSTFKEDGCGREECCSSTGICGHMTFGTGVLSNEGYWEFPCGVCEASWIKNVGTTDIESNEFRLLVARDKLARMAPTQSEEEA